MHYLIINRTRTDLKPEEWAELGGLAQEFYDNVPEGVVLHGDWAATDGSRTFALIEADDAEKVERIQQPFRRFVEIEVVPVERVTGWGRREAESPDDR